MGMRGNQPQRRRSAFTSGHGFGGHPGQPFDQQGSPFDQQGSPFDQQGSYQHPFQQPRRRSPVGPIVAVVASVLVVAVIAVAAVGLLVRPGVAEPSVAHSPPPSPIGQTSFEPTPSASVAEPTPTESAAEPTPTESVDEPSASSSTPSTTDVLQRNRLYAVPADEWSCEALSNPAVRSGDKFEGYADDVLSCIEQRWTPLLTRAGYENTTVGVIHFTGEITSPCGGGAQSADLPPFYCSANETIYVNGDTVDLYDDGVRLGGLSILMHEYGHHVQFGAGILEASQLVDEDQAQISRRIELQNECWTYNALQQLTTTDWNARDEEEFRYWASEDQDDQHGRGASYTYWFNRILDKTDLQLCNTWTADRGRVR